MTKTALFRHSQKDAALVALALAQGLLLALLLAGPRSAAARAGAAGALALGLWWNSNTISHNHLHNPVFGPRWLNRAFSLYLSLLLGVPQTLWRNRHLWHHAGEPAAPRPRPLGALGLLEVLVVGLSWLALLLAAPPLFLYTYLPGYLAGMGLCHLQGHFEHTTGGGRDLRGISHYGRLYNLLWFNDGHHAEHHRHPGEHWARLPALRRPGEPRSPLPPVLRWLEALRPPLLRLRSPLGPLLPQLLGRLERLALRPGVVQRFMLRSHERALRALLPALGGRPLRRVAIVGGGLFPRTARLLLRLLPGAQLTLLDQDAHHLALARHDLVGSGADLGRLAFLAEAYDPARHHGFDLIVIPLAYVGDREVLYAAGGPPRLVHDWLWRARGRGVIVSLLLLKRLNLVAP